MAVGIAALWLGISPAAADPQQDFPTWLDGVKVDARAQGISQNTLDAALAGIQPIDRVLELDRKQPEFTLSFDQYLSRVVSPARVQQGHKLLVQNKAILSAVSAKYGVPASVITAMWGIETDFGRLTGGFKVVPALATLAYDGRRSQYFRTELINALLMIDSGKVTPEQMTGSWAGAMGQCQFMPSTYLHYARDWNGSGKPDIWGTQADVFASAANYLSQIGWNDSYGWGRQVKIPKDLNAGLFSLDVKKSYKAWNKLGIRTATGKPLPKSDVLVSLIRAETGKGDDIGRGAPYLVTDNFRVFMKWNRSTFFALAAGTLADRLASK
jgi:membrane-bound lytic murein transglycosylase B